MNGIPINIDPVALRLGGIEVRWYSLFVLLALAVATVVAIQSCKKKGISVDKVLNLMLWVTVGGMVGARLFHVLDHISFYAQNPRMILGFDGLAIWGALIGGGVALVIFAKVEKLSLLPLLDAAVPAALAGQIVGRFACIINGDAYGGPTSLPWGFIYTQPGALIPDYLKGLPTHPYPVYEQVWNLATLAVVLMLSRRFKSPGTLFLVYVCSYAVGRFVLTFFRQETVLFWGLQEAQVISLGLLAIAVPLLARSLNREKRVAHLAEDLA